MSSSSKPLFKKKKKKGKSKNRGVKRKAGADGVKDDASKGETKSAEGADEEDLTVDVIALQRSRSRRRGNGITTSKLLKPRKDAWAEADAAATAAAEEQQQQEQINAPKVGLQTNDAFNSRGGMVTSSADDAEATAKEEQLKSLMQAFVNREVQKVKSTVNGGAAASGGASGAGASEQGELGSSNPGVCSGLTVASSLKPTLTEHTKHKSTGPAAPAVAGESSSASAAASRAAASSAAAEDDGTSGGPLAWNTGLAEVALPAADKWRNIERTAQMTERSVQRGYSGRGGGSGSGSDLNDP